MIKLILISIIAFLGSVAGIILARIAKEEIEPGKKYLNILQRVLLFILFIGFLYNTKLSIYSVLAFAIGFIVSTLIKYKYFYLGIASTLSLIAHSQLTIFVNSIIFLYGLPYGSLLKDNKKIIINAILYFIPLSLLLIRPQLVPIEHYIFAFAAGSLFHK